MNRFLALLLLLLLATGAASAQDSILPFPADEVDTFLELLDAIEAAQSAVLSEPGLVSQEDLASLRELVGIAESFGAEDLAARARSLIVLASVEGASAPPVLQSVDTGENVLDSDPPARDTETFRRWVNVGATAGASALGMSAVFAYLAERNYQNWVNEGDTDLAAQLYRAWRGYDYLALGLGTATLISVGVGMPLVFALTPPATTLATPPETELFTAEGREAELERLYAERLEVVGEFVKLNSREDRRTVISTIALGTGAVGTIVAGTFFYVAEEVYDRYLEATTDADALKYSRRLSLLDGVAVSSGLLAGAGFGTAAAIELFTPGRAQLQRDLERINKDIIRVRGSRTIDAPDPEPEPAAGERRRLFGRNRDDESGGEAAADSAASEDAAE